jgi:hypothetical protein
MSEERLEKEKKEQSEEKKEKKDKCRAKFLNLITFNMNP